MADPNKVRETVERAVHEAVVTRVNALREEIVTRVLEELQPVLAQQGSISEQMRIAMAGIHESTVQSDILRALIDGVALFSGRAALFVIRGTSAVGWQARGFRDNDAVKILTLDMGSALAARAAEERCAVSGPAEQFDARFITGFGAPADGECLVVPLVIREKVAALVYADGGTESTRWVDADALQLLVRAAGLWVELLALRKSGSAPAAQAAAAGAAAAAAPAPAPAATPRVEPPPAPVAAPERTTAPPVPENEDELHRKARRFAKLLVDEIRLYNQAKLAEGKQHHDVYDRLKEDIEKSRTAYDKRYGHAAVRDYFTQELVRILADNDPALLGGNFPR